MGNSIKEDIERLKLCSTNQCHICGRYEKEECMLARNRCEQHLLSAYKKILKENEKLKALDSSNSKMIANMSKRHFQDREKIRNSIPVSLVKDKIEELNRKIDNGGKTYGRYGGCVINSENIMKLQNQIEALQELLEKEE